MEQIDGGSTQECIKRDDIETLSYPNSGLFEISNLMSNNGLLASSSNWSINPNLQDKNNERELISNENVAIAERSESKAITSVEVNYNKHMLAERERRGGMKNMFDELHSLVPNLPPKANQCTIVEGTINYIKSLEQTLHQLERKKQDIKKAVETKDVSYIGNSPPLTPMPYISNGFSTWSWGNNITLSVSGEEAYLNICTSKKPGLITSIASVLQNHRIEVVSAQLTSNNLNCMYNIHAHYSMLGTSVQNFNTSMVEEAFKKAVDEIALYLNQL